MKLKRISSIVAASLMAVVTVIGLSGTAKASETQYTNLCVLDNGNYVCAYAQGAGNTIFMLPKSQTLNNTTNWYWPDTDTYGVIDQAQTDLCMQLDADAGYVVIEATCTSSPASYQEWYLTASGQFISEWAPNQCLTYNASLARLDTVTCNGAWYQRWWGPST